jgi:hypothetical protein
MNWQKNPGASLRGAGRQTSSRGSEESEKAQPAKQEETECGATDTDATKGTKNVTFGQH